MVVNFHHSTCIDLLFRISSLFLILGVSSCTQPEVPSNKVIVIHARGISYSDLVNYLDASKANSFFQRKAEVNAIQKLEPITNAVTISNIASFETGGLPSEHGILGHAFAFRKNMALQGVSGFSQRFTNESFWETADKKSKKVLNVGALVLRGKYEQHTHVDCIAQGAVSGSPKQLRLIPDPENSSNAVVVYKNLEGQPYHSLQRGKADSIFVYQLTSHSDELVLDEDLDFANGSLGKVKKEAWLEIEQEKTDYLKSAFRLKYLDSTNDTLDLYIRASFSNRGYPNEFLQQIDSAIGPSKGWPNIPLFTSNGISSGTLVEEINTELNYVMDAFSFAAQQKNYDLIMIDYPLMDRLGHAFLRLRDSSQMIQQHYRNAFERMSEDFSLIEQFANEHAYELIITSGHGFSPIHTSMDINKFIRRNGFNTNANTDNWEVVGLPGKVSAHIYVNEQLDSIRRRTVIKTLEMAFQNLTHSTSDQPVMDELYRNSDLSRIGLDHQNAGDLFVLLNPGFVFENNKFGEGTIWGVPTFNGDHGYSLKHEDSFAVFISDGECDPCKSTDVAKMILDGLGLD